MGKTRLSLEAATRHAETFPHGIFFVPLAPLNSASDIVTTMISVLGIHIGDDATPREELIKFLSKRHLLLIMDNFEHVLKGVEIVAEILRTAPDVKIMATSREVLNLQEEWVWQVKGLRCPDDIQDTETKHYDALQLFLDRVQRVKRDFDADTELACAIHICQIVDGMPLALELAASWLNSLTCKDVSQQIERGIDFLTTRVRDVPERHRSVRAVFEHSWHLLSPEEQTVFPRLSVFRGGFTLAATESVSDATLISISGLVEKSMVRQLSSGRYDLHELLRQFGEEKLSEAEQTATIQQAHASYYMTFLKDLKPRIFSCDAGAAEAIVMELENIRRAWWWVVAQHQYAHLEEAADCLFAVNHGRTFRWEVFEVFQQTVAILAPATDETPHPVWDKIALMTEWLSNDMSWESGNQSLVEAILARAKLRGDKRETGWAIHVLSQIYRQSGNHETAITYGQQALQVWRDVNDSLRLGMIMVPIGYSLLETGQPEQAQQVFEEVLAIRRLLVNDGWCLPITLNHLSFFHLLHCRLTEAIAYSDEAIVIIRSHRIVDDPVNTGLFTPALLMVLRGHLEDAHAFINEIKVLVARNRRDISRRIELIVEGLIVSIRGDDATLRSLVAPSQAELSLLEALTSKIGIGLTCFVPWFTALMYCCLGEDARATLSLNDLIKLGWRMKSSTLQYISLPIAAVLAARESRPDRAVELLALAYTAPEELRGWVDKWQLLQETRQQLETQFDAEDFRRLWKQGTQLDMKQVVGELRREQDNNGGNPVKEANASLPNPLTPKELEVLALLAEGLKNPQIGERLFITTGTVKGHVNKILHKLDVETRQQAVSQAQVLNLLKT